MTITLNNNLFSIEAKDIPLDEVLRALTERTGTEITLRDTSFSQDPVSVSFSDLTFDEMIERIFRNYNYILQYRDALSADVIVLSSKGPAGALSAKESPAPRHKTGLEENARVLEKGAEPPRTIDDCQRLDLTEEDVANLTRGSGNISERKKQVSQEYKGALLDARIKRAKVVLGMKKCSHLWKQAIDEISGIQDDQATGLLAEIAESGDAQIRGTATKALWHHVAASSFKNTGGLSALKQLTGSPDQSVSMWAKDALKDFEGHERREAQAANDAKTNVMKGGGAEKK